MKEFFITHYYEIILVLVSIINIVVSVFSRKVKLVDSVFEQAMVKLPEFINKAESLNVSGVEKKTFVLSALIAFIAKLTGQSEDIIHQNYYSRLDSAIEAILSTPKKKEEIK